MEGTSAAKTTPAKKNKVSERSAVGERRLKELIKQEKMLIALREREIQYWEGKLQKYLS